MEQTKNHIWSGGLFLMLLALLFTAFGCTDFSTDKPAKRAALPETAAGETQQLLQADDVLHARLRNVQAADNQYNQLATSGATTAALDEKGGQVIQAEIALQQTIDSLDKLPAAHSEIIRTGLARLTGYFKATLESRRALSDLRMMLSANSDDSTSMHQTLTQLRAELLQKNKQIAALEQRNKTGNPSNYTVETVAPNSNAPARGESLADLQQRNKNLALALNNLQVKYFTLGRDYLVLKKEHERTLNELAALRNGSRQK